MAELKETLYGYLDGNLRQMILSGVKNKDGASKIRIRPVLVKEQLLFQCTKTIGPKEFHSNHGKEEILALVQQWMNQDFKQLQLDSDGGTVSVLVSKKGKMTIKEKKKMMGTSRAAGELTASRIEELSHNRKKKYILEEGRPVEFLIDLGVMT